MANEGKQPVKGQQGVARSFDHAYRGLIYAVRTQRNMRFHVVVAALVLIGSLFLDVSKLELAVLVLVIMFVFVTEIINTALEFAVDLVTKEYHPLAKFSKDISAGAVLVSSVGAVLVGYLILANNLGPLSLKTIDTIRRTPAHLTLVALGVVVLLVLMGKALTRLGSGSCHLKIKNRIRRCSLGALQRQQQHISLSATAFQLICTVEGKGDVMSCEPQHYQRLSIGPVGVRLLTLKPPRPG